MLDSLRKHYAEPEQQRAIDLLLDPSNYPAMRQTPQRRLHLQVYTIPSFHPITTWSVFEPKDGVYLIRRVRWDFAVDYHVASDTPSTWASDVEIERGEVDHYIDNLRAISAPVFQLEHNIGLDGVTLGLRYHAGMGNFIEFSWWCEPPSNCHVIADWHESMVNFLESRLPRHTVPSGTRLR